MKMWINTDPNLENYWSAEKKPELIQKGVYCVRHKRGVDGQTRKIYPIILSAKSKTACPFGYAKSVSEFFETTAPCLAVFKKLPPFEWRVDLCCQTSDGQEELLVKIYALNKDIVCWPARHLAQHNRPALKKWYKNIVEKEMIRQSFIHRRALRVKSVMLGFPVRIFDKTIVFRTALPGASNHAWCAVHHDESAVVVETGKAFIHYASPLAIERGVPFKAETFLR